MNEDAAGQNVRVDLILSQHVELLQRIAVGTGLNVDTSEDIRQDVFLEALQRAPKFQEMDEARRWLVRVTVNRCLLEFRRRKRHGQKIRQVLQRRNGREKAQAGLAPQIIRAEEMEAVRQGLGRLSELLRVPLVLKYYCGLNASEIAEILELKPATVRKRLCEGRIVLAKALLQRGIRP